MALFYFLYFRFYRERGTTEGKRISWKMQTLFSVCSPAKFCFTSKHLYNPVSAITCQIYNSDNIKISSHPILFSQQPCRKSDCGTVNRIMVVQVIKHMLGSCSHCVMIHHFIVLCSILSIQSFHTITMLFLCLALDSLPPPLHALPSLCQFGAFPLTTVIHAWSTSSTTGYIPTC